MDKNKNSHSDKVGEGVNLPLTEDVNQILDALVERYSTVSRSMLQYEPDKTLVELKKCSVEVCPYYEFDVQKFYAAPSPAQILECLSLPQDKACLLGKRTDGTTFLLITIKEGGVWKMESMIEDWEKVVSWLPGKLLNADTKDYKMFTLYAMTYFLFYRDGELIYCDLTGKEYTPDKACEELVNEVNRMNLYQEKVKEMKSKTDTDLKL
ncbi:hypothetical protein CE91St24_14620 [Odoribacteraceae bacterium]|jgi:hypothetical protein|nr:hypothetical protein CE91St21_29650 [Odoribacteraceae bacterium]GKH94395.1 hypothetical protein CE91St23_28910 [Odoribacteraceae bacterium]GKH98721.1 hypothetical protein CE91St22_25990 [Odoribacteraceae bacterium]GKI02187.1 hypothetical protein CE91St24_14620 [Odoribacteraceae bacterium]